MRTGYCIPHFSIFCFIFVDLNQSAEPRFINKSKLPQVAHQHKLQHRHNARYNNSATAVYLLAAGKFSFTCRCESSTREICKYGEVTDMKMGNLCERRYARLAIHFNTTIEFDESYEWINVTCSEWYMCDTVSKRFRKDAGCTLLLRTISLI